MPMYRIEETTLTDIANAIRSKVGSTSTFKPTEMASAIAMISGAGEGTDISFLMSDNVTTIPLSDALNISVDNGIVSQVLLNGIAIWGEKPKFTNLLPFATDLDRKTIYNSIGYKANTRLSSSTTTVGSAVSFTGMYTSGFIPAQAGDILRIKGTTPKSSTDSYVISFDSANTRIAAKPMLVKESPLDWAASSATVSKAPYQKYENGILEIDLSSTYFGTGFDAIRFSAGLIDENTIVTINEKIPV